MKSEKIIAIIALGAVAVIGFGMYKKNSTGDKKNNYLNASGSSGNVLSRKTQNCAVCRDSEGNNYHTGSDRNCTGKDTCVTRYAFSASE